MTLPPERGPEPPYAPAPPQYAPAPYAQAPYAQAPYAPAPYAPASSADPSAPDQAAWRAGRNGLAIASFILGLCAAIPIAFVLALVFGIVALTQIRKTHQRGKGFAIAGITLAGLWAVGIATAVVIGIATSDGSNVSVNRLAVGDCVRTVGDEGEIDQLPSVPCSQPHRGEVYAIFDLADGAYPGDKAVDDQASGGCVDRIAAYSARAAGDDAVGYFYLMPTERTWRLRDRSVICLLTTDDPRTGSLKD